MSHCYRFFSNLINQASDEEQALWQISTTELHHLTKVLRLKTGEVVEVFDGKGYWGKGQITEITATEALVSTPSINHELQDKNSVGIAIGALRNQSMNEVLPFLVELGVNEIHIFMQKNVAQYRISQSAQSRWQKIILSSLKQCKRNYLPCLHIWKDLSQMTSYLIKNFDHHLLLSPHAKNSMYSVILPDGKVCAVIGGEKGLTVEEENILLQASFKSVHTNNAILRSTTTAIVTSFFMTSKRSLPLKKCR